MSEYEVNEVEVMEEEVGTEEEVDTTVDELKEETTNSEETEENETEEQPDPVLEWLKEQKFKADGQEYGYDNLEDLKRDARTGRTVERIKEQRDKYRNDPGFKFMQDYMKSSGYKDMGTFVHDLKVTQKQEELISKGMNETDAKAEAEMFVKNFQPTADPRDVDISNFVEWHTNKFGNELNPDDIPSEVLEAYERGESLKEAFLEHEITQTKVKTEQETLKKLRNNKETSSGELNKSKHNSTKDMTVAQIDKLLDGMSPSQQSKWADDNYNVLEKAGYFNR